MNYAFTFVVLPGVFWGLTIGLQFLATIHLWIVQFALFLSSNVVVPAVVGVVAYQTWRLSGGRIRPHRGTGWATLVGIHLLVMAWMVRDVEFAVVVDEILVWPIASLQTYFYVGNLLAPVLTVGTVQLAAKLHWEQTPPGRYFHDLLRNVAPGLFRE